MQDKAGPIRPAAPVVTNGSSPAALGQSSDVALFSAPPSPRPERVLSWPLPFYRWEGSQKGSGQSHCQRQAVGFGAPPAPGPAEHTWGHVAGESEVTPRAAHWDSGSAFGLLAALPSRSSLKGRLRHPEKNGSEALSISPLSANAPADFTGVFRQEAAGPGDKRPLRHGDRRRGQRAPPVAASPRAACLILLDPEAPLHFPVCALAV